MFPPHTAGYLGNISLLYFAPINRSSLWVSLQINSINSGNRTGFKASFITGKLEEPACIVLSSHPAHWWTTHACSSYLLLLPASPTFPSSACCIILPLRPRPKYIITVTCVHYLGLGLIIRDTYYIISIAKKIESQKKESFTAPDLRSPIIISPEIMHSFHERTEHVSMVSFIMELVN